VIAVREARPGDAAAIVPLLNDLGSDHSGEDVASRLAALAATGADPVFVACVGERIVGVIGMHLMQPLHVRGRTARIMALSVAGDVQRQGVGRRLIAQAIAVARQGGCTLLELTTGMDRTGAQAFYCAQGFEASSLRFRMRLAATAPADTAPASSRP
jgi:GNAT superfamily N-acetyltransferase